MSRSYTVKGSYARQTSGARPTERDGQLGPGNQMTDPDNSASKPPENERYQRREAYTMIAPNEDKRNKLLQAQQRGEEISRQRKEMKGKTPIKMKPEKVGGEEVPCSIIRHQQQQQTNLSPTLKAMEMRQKREKWRQDKKMKEEQEIHERKLAARQQAERNEKKASLHSETVRRHWDEKYKQPSYSSVEEQESCSHNQVNDPNTDHHTPDGRENGDLAELCRMYPECDPTCLREILYAEGSIEGVQALLGYSY